MKNQYTPTFDILKFIESPFGLGFSKPLGDYSLYPVQRFILKALYGLPLGNKEQVLKIPKGWQQAASEESQDYYLLTEQDYFNYLVGKGHLSPPTIRKGQRPSKVALVLGRRSGLTTLLNFCALYDTCCLLENFELNTLIEQDETWKGLFEIAHYSTNLNQSTRHSKAFQDSYEKFDFLSEKNTIQTRTSHYFDSPYLNEKDGVRCVFNSFRSTKSIRGSQPPHHLYVDCAGFADEEFYLVIEPVVSTAKSVVFATSSPSENTPFEDFYDQCVSEPDSLALKIPTWEVNPTIPAQHYQGEWSRSGEDIFLNTYGTDFLEED